MSCWACGNPGCRIHEKNYSKEIRSNRSNQGNGKRQVLQACRALPQPLYTTRKHINTGPERFASPAPVRSSVNSSGLTLTGTKHEIKKHCRRPRWCRHCSFNCETARIQDRLREIAGAMRDSDVATGPGFANQMGKHLGATTTLTAGKTRWSCHLVAPASIQTSERGGDTLLDPWVSVGNKSQTKRCSWPRTV